MARQGLLLLLLLLLLTQLMQTKHEPASEPLCA
jgi:hypothetical protein